jgi:hypothetical protein
MKGINGRENLLSHYSPAFFKNPSNKEVMPTHAVLSAIRQTRNRVI